MGGSVTTKQTTAPQKDAMAYYQDLLSRLKEVGELGYTPYEGERVAGFTPYQQMAMQSVENLQGAGRGTLQEAIAAGRRGTEPITTADIQRYQDPYQTMMVDAFTAKMRQQEAEDISKLQGTSISAGAFGGDRAKLAQAQMMRNQEQERNARISDLMSRGYSQAVSNAQADREAAARGSSLLSSLSQQEVNQPLSYINALYGMGRGQQELEQQRLNVPYETYLEQRAFPYQQLQYLAGVGTGVGSQMGGTSKTKDPGPSIFSQLLGAGTSLGSAALMGMSDERLKENIEDVGVTNDGQTIYKYNYKGDPKTHIGLLAQEVEQTHPEAVGQIAGFKAVNYDLATRDSVRKADGGGLTDPFSGQTGMFAKGFIPGISPVKGEGAPRPPSPKPKDDNSAQSMIDSALDLASAIKKRQTDPTNPASWQTTTTLSPENPASWNTSVSQPNMLSQLGSYLGLYAHGGGVHVPYKQVGGGLTDETEVIPPRLMDYSIMARRMLEDEKPPTETAENKTELPEVIIPEGEKKPSSGISEPYGKSGGQQGEGFGSGLFNLSPEAKQALFTSGLAMMAGTSPNALTNIGAGGLAGVKYYNELMKAKQEEAQKKREFDIKEMEAKRKAGELDIVGTGFVDENGNPIGRDRNTGRYYDSKENPLSKDAEMYPAKNLTLPPKAEETLINASKTYEQLNRHSETFNPQYSGKILKSWAEIQNVLGRNLPLSDDLRKQAEWWQSYNLYRNQARNLLFGSQLTKTEKEAFDAADISPEQDPIIIQHNLERQRLAASTALYKLMNSKIKQRYIPSTIEGITEHSLDELLEERESLKKAIDTRSKSTTPSETATSTPSEVKNLPQVSSQTDFDALKQQREKTGKPVQYFNTVKNKVEWIP